MSTLTSVGGMLPLVLMPGSGSELYRGLGSVVVGGLIVSTIFTLFLVPLLLGLLFDVQALLRREATPARAATARPMPAPAPSPALRANPAGSGAATSDEVIGAGAARHVEAAGDEPH